ncbi:MAG: hypothetical protein HY851_09635, partial [candidate division Zixibacteria bacterium]|nr:hypothetical protein [candidate division Zixibacteria bacterium]
MTKKIASLLLTVLVLVAFMAAWSFARDQYESAPKKVVDPYTGKIVDYDVKKVAEKPVKWGDDAPNPSAQGAPSSQPERMSLGTAAAPRDAASSPGMPLYYTYMDDQYRSPGKRMVDFRGKRPDVHFVYSRTTDPLEAARFGYNVYDPITGTWPRGYQVGCVIQNTGEAGEHAIMDVNGKGYVAI